MLAANTTHVAPCVRAPRRVACAASSVDRRAVLLGSVLATQTGAGQAAQGEFASARALAVLNREGAFKLTDQQWRERLTPAQYGVLRRAGTELPLSSELNNEKRKGTFLCAGCGAKLFSSETKFNSGTGWPSFFTSLEGAVTIVPDNSIIFLPRDEVRCQRCQGHLGHVFNDGPKPTGLRYCMNGAALTFEPASV